jgi:hypothetical protein
MRAPYQNGLIKKGPVAQVFEQQALKLRPHHVVGIAPGIKIATATTIAAPTSDTKNGFAASPQ